MRLRSRLTNRGQWRNFMRLLRLRSRMWITANQLIEFIINNFLGYQRFKLDTNGIGRLSAFYSMLWVQLTHVLGETTWAAGKIFIIVRTAKPFPISKDVRGFDHLTVFEMLNDLIKWSTHYTYSAFINSILESKNVINHAFSTVNFIIRSHNFSNLHAIIVISVPFRSLSKKILLIKIYL